MRWDCALCGPDPTRGHDRPLWTTQANRMRTLPVRIAIYGSGRGPDVRLQAQRVPLSPPWDALRLDHDDGDWDFTSAVEDTPQELYALWDSTIAPTSSGRRSTGW